MPSQAIAAGWAFVLAVAEEFRRATAAAHRYEQLKRMARAGDEPELNAARRIYTEFYSHAARSDSPHGSGLRAVLQVPRETARMNSRYSINCCDSAVTFISWALQNKVSVWDVSGLTATSVSTILQVYGHHVQDGLRDAANAVVARSAQRKEQGEWSVARIA